MAQHLPLSCLSLTCCSLPVTLTEPLMKPGLMQPLWHQLCAHQHGKGRAEYVCRGRDQLRSGDVPKVCGGTGFRTHFKLSASDEMFLK